MRKGRPFQTHSRRPGGCFPLLRTGQNLRLYESGSGAHPTACGLRPAPPSGRCQHLGALPQTPRSPRGRGAGLRACGPSLPHPSRERGGHSKASRDFRGISSAAARLPVFHGSLDPFPFPVPCPGTEWSRVKGGTGSRMRSAGSAATEHRTGEDDGAKPDPLTLWNDPNALGWWLGVLFPQPPAPWRTWGSQAKRGRGQGPLSGENGLKPFAASETDAGRSPPFPSEGAARCKPEKSLPAGQAFLERSDPVLIRQNKN